MDKVTSTHKVECVPVVLQKHPNADLLSVASVWGYSCVTNTEQWKGIDKAYYLPPDSTVLVNRPEFTFLIKDAKQDGRARIKAKKIRGVLSFGLLVPAPAEAVIGEDYAAQLEVEHYDPAVRRSNSKEPLFTSGEMASGPDVYSEKYDLEAGRRYGQQVFSNGETVVLEEKLHGMNSRFVYHNGKMYCGSRTEWKKEYPSFDHVTVESLVATGKVDEAQAAVIVDKLRNAQKKKNIVWKALEATPTLQEFCIDNPGRVVYGEVYGDVQDLNYGCKSGELRFAAFDVLENGKWLDWDDRNILLDNWEVPVVPLVARIPFDFDKVCELAEGDSLIPGANHLREGVVVRPLAERYDDRVGRVVLKWVSACYLERSK